MKKTLIKIIALTLCVFTVGSLGACGKKAAPRDPKTILISVYNGGLGTEWIDPIVAEFEADYPEYNIEIERRKRTVSEIDEAIALGSQADAYISCVSDFHLQIYSNELEDLSDLLTMKPDGEDGLTIAEKMNDLDKWRTIASKDGQGIYMLPYEDLVLGFNYDHTKFVEYGLMIDATNDTDTKSALDTQGITYTEQGTKLVFVSSTGETNYKQGDIILRAGKDGKYGTYDDGQPETITEWNLLVNTIKGLGRVFIYPGNAARDYTTDIFNGILAQYDGLDAWNTLNTFSGTYTFEGDATPTTITLDNGYKVYGMTGFKKATEFLQTYLNDRNLVHELAFMSEEGHADAQGKYVIGGAKDSADAPFTGMIVEGSWWENEAKGRFNELSADSRYSDYEFGTRDYRIMLFPELEGQKGIDGNGNGTVLSARSTGSMIVPKQDNDDKLEMIKLFLSYTLKDKWLRHFTVTTGGIRPYEYDLTTSDKAQMTVYAKNVWELYNDTQNIAIVRPLLDRYLTAVPYKTSKGTAVNYYSKLSSTGLSYNMPIDALRTAINSGLTSSQAINTVYEGFEAYFSGAWQGYLDELGR